MENEAAARSTGDPRLEYDRAVKLLAELTEIRFRLLALVPTLAGAVVALISPTSPAIAIVAIGLLGLAATSGVVVYELRNTQLRRSVAARVRGLEADLLPGGPLGPGAPHRLWRLELTHGLGTALVYGAALAGWCYLVAWGVLRAAEAGHARAIGVAIGAAAGAAVVFGLLCVDEDA